MKPIYLLKYSFFIQENLEERIGLNNTNLQYEIKYICSHNCIFSFCDSIKLILLWYIKISV